jgi:hypothetical protein
MDDNKKSIRDQTATVIGGLAAGAVGALAGPDVALISTAVGSVSALYFVNYVPSVLKNTFHRYLSNKKVCKLLQDKIDTDFQNSFLDSQGRHDAAIELARSFINTANGTDNSIGTFESRWEANHPWNLSASHLTEAEYETHLQSLVAYCKAIGPIRIACASICAAPSAIFRSLEHRFGESRGLHFELYNDETNARDLFRALEGECDYDFVIGPIEALVHCDRNRALPLRLIGPLFGERQWVFVSTKNRKGFRPGIWVFTHSTAELHYRVGVGVPRSAEKQIIENVSDMPPLFEAIPAGDMVIAWDPLANLLTKHKQYATVPQSEYTIHFFLLGHKRIFKKHQFPREAFLGIFLTEWRRYRHDHAHLSDYLYRDTRFMHAFAEGCGYIWTKQF